MNAARMIFGIIYLLGAPFNIFIVVTQGWQAYIGFADDTFLPFNREAWMAIAAPRIILIVVLLIAFEIGLGLLFIIRRRYLKIALILGTLFCLASMPAMRLVLESGRNYCIVTSLSRHLHQFQLLSGKRDALKFSRFYGGILAFG